MAKAWALAARCSLRGLLWTSGIGSILVGGAAMTGAPNAIGVALIVAVTLIVFALHSAWQLADGLARFADAVPAEGQAEAQASGAARVAWPSMNLAVQGQAGVLRRVELEGEAGGQPFEGPVDEARGLAEEALADLGIEVTPGEASN